MKLISLQTLLIGIVTILFGWWYNNALIPYLFPHLVGTPAAGFYSVIASVVVWILLTLCFLRHDHAVAKSAGGKQ